jgi:hypothetical protein
MHGDSLHIKTILDVIRASYETHDMKIKLFMEPYEISHYGLNGSEEYIFIDKAQYQDVPFPVENGLLDIHVGAYETAEMQHSFRIMSIIKK